MLHFCCNFDLTSVAVFQQSATRGRFWPCCKTQKNCNNFCNTFATKSNTPKHLFLSLLYPIFSICCNVAKILQQITHSIFSPKYCLTGLSPRFVKNSFIVWPFFQQNTCDTSQKTRKMGSIARTLPILQGIIRIRMRFFMWFLPPFQRKVGGSLCPTQSPTPPGRAARTMAKPWQRAGLVVVILWCSVRAAQRAHLTSRRMSYRRIVL